MLEKVESCPECKSKMTPGWIGEKGSLHWYDNPKPIRTIFGLGEPIFNTNPWSNQSLRGKQEARRCNNCGLIVFKSELAVKKSFLRNRFTPILFFFAVMILVTVVAGLVAMHFALELGRPTPVPAAAKVMSNISPITGFRYFSGYYDATGNRPAIYAYRSNDSEKLRIVGAGLDQEMPMQQSDRAFELYKDLLLKRGYKPK